MTKHFTLRSAPQRVRDLLPDEAESLIANRFAVVNVWKPISGSVQESPLAFQDARTVADGDVLATDLRYHERTGEIYSYTYNPGHRWYYYPEMRRDEALLIKQWDSAGTLARSDGARADADDQEAPCTFNFHSAFTNPSTPQNAPDRWSIEVRCLVVY